MNRLPARHGRLFIPLIAMDWTEEHDMRVLSFSFIWGRRAIPFWWHARPKGTLSRSRNSLESNAGRLLKSWMGGRGFILPADRGFHRTAFIRALSNKHGIDFVIRVMKSTHVSVKGHRGALGQLRLQVNKVRDFRLALYGSSARVPVRLVVKKVKVKRQQKNKRKSGYSTWYLVTSIKEESKQRMVGYYERRYGIEASYRDRKTAPGWKRQRYIRDGERLIRRLPILTMVMIRAPVAAERKKVRKKKYIVMPQRSLGSNESASIAQLGIRLIHWLSDRETSLRHEILFRVRGL